MTQHRVGRLPDSGDFRDTRLRPLLPTFAGRPVWILSGQVGIALVVARGFGAYSLKPNLFIFLLFVCMSVMILLGPRRLMEKIVVSGPVVAILSWWAVSRLWTFNPSGWQRESELFLPMLAGLVVIVGLLPVEKVFSGLLAGCQMVIAYCVFFTLTSPGIAMSHGDGTPGWTGSFIHKNAMAPFMVFAILVAASFDDRVFRRRLTYGVAGVFVLMSQSTTVLFAACILFPLMVLVRGAAHLPRAGRSTLALVSTCIMVVAGALQTLVIEPLLATRGKDTTLTSRTEIWEGVWAAIVERPLSGYGIGGVWLNPAAEPTSSILSGLGFTVFHAHNGYLELLLQVGVIGLALVVLQMVLLLRDGLLLLSTDSKTGSFLILFVALIAVTSLAEVTTFGVWLSLLAALHVVGLRMRKSTMV